MPEVLGHARIDLALDECREMIRVGSKSFSLAAKIFQPTVREGAFFLYGWCRYCDDQVDEAGSRDEAVRALQDLRLATSAAFRGDLPSQGVFVAFQRVVHVFGIPQEYALELLEGMEMDVSGRVYETWDELRLYCFRVAGTVGLMMAHVMGVNDERALKNAVDLGIGMQLTNIARDIADDYRMGRVYLPQSWLKEAGISADRLLDPSNSVRLAQVVQRLLQEADGFYHSGTSGLGFLSIRSAFAVAAAGEVYSEIGRAVLKRGIHAWDSRTIVPGWKKLICVLKGGLRVLCSLPGRMIRPTNPVAIKEIWRHS